MKFKLIPAFALSAMLAVPQGVLGYTAKSGDTYWKIAKSHGASLQSLLLANGKTENSVLNIGDTVLLPGIDVHIAKEGDTYWKIAKNYGISFETLLGINNAGENSMLYIGQIVRLKSFDSGTEPYVTYTSYYIKSGDTLWTLSEKFGVPYDELCEVNKKVDAANLYSGLKITVPVHHVPEIPHPDGCGEYLDWQNAARYIVPIGKIFTVTDFYTGQKFTVKRTLGANHADCEPLSSSDTAVMKKIWGGAFSWQSRPVLITCDGRTLAASAASFPHAGNDAAPAGKWTSWRSGDYGSGENYDYVKGNNFDGHFDLYFKGCTSHNTGKTNESHEKNIRIAAGI